MTTPNVSQGDFDRADRLASTAAQMMQATQGQQSQSADIVRKVAQVFAERAMALLGTPSEVPAPNDDRRAAKERDDLGLDAAAGVFAAPVDATLSGRGRPTLEQYLIQAAGDGIVDHVVRFEFSDHTARFYIRPQHQAGDTVQYATGGHTVVAVQPGSL